MIRSFVSLIAVALSAATAIEMLSYGSGSLYLYILIAAAVVFAVSLVILITSFFAKGRSEAYRNISQNVTSKVFFEIKWALFSLTAILLCYGIVIFTAYAYAESWRPYGYLDAVCAAALLWLTVFGVRIFAADLDRLGAAGYFKNSYFVWLFKSVADMHAENRPFRKTGVFTVTYAVLVFGSFALAVPGLLLSGAFVLTVIGVILFILSTAGYCVSVLPLIRDLDKFTDKIFIISKGGSDDEIALPETSDAYPLDRALDNVARTCRANAEKAIEEEKARIELITNVSHDLKTPLTSIISYTELLSGTEGLGEEAREYVNILAVKENRLKKLIEDLFDLSKASVTIHKDGLQTIDFTTLVKQQLSYNSDTIDASGLVFDVTLPETELTVKADGAKLHNVIENLINNAIKYSLSGSRVYVTLSEENKTARFEIKNISRDKLNVDPAKLTERFVRGDESRTEEGSGLGLAIAKTYTELCGGRFDLSLDGDLFKVALSFDTVVTSE